MGPTQKPNVCRQLSRRALGFFSRDAGVVQRTNLGILRVLVCQVTAGCWEWGQGQRGDWRLSLLLGCSFYSLALPFKKITGDGQGYPGPEPGELVNSY